MREALIAITSGSLISHAKYLRTGPFREDYFIGFVDAEYCLRTWALGFRVALNCGVTIDHAIGNRVAHRVLGLTLKPTFQTPLRNYYSVRNGIRTSLDHAARFPLFLPFILAALSLGTLAIMLYEDDKTRKLLAVLAGFFHGLTGRMGRCPFKF